MDKRRDDWHQNLKLAYLADDFHYADSSIKLKSQAISQQAFFYYTGSRQIHPNHRLLLLLPGQLSWMRDQRTAEMHYQSRLALATAWNWTPLQQKLETAVSLRGEFINRNFILLPGLNAAFHLRKNLTLKANIQKTYRAPTLNELYYNPGGNPDLKAESGWHADAGYALKVRRKSFTFSQELSLYARDINNWIIWYGGAIWTPHNIATVRSLGAELSNSIAYNTGDWQLRANANIAYTKATTQKSVVQNDGSIGSQIPYVPELTVQGGAGLSWRRFSVDYSHTFTSLRYITSDESEWTDAYHLGNFRLAYSAKISGRVLEIFGSVGNGYNSEYAVIAYRPMPGRNFQGGVVVRFSN